MADKTLEQMLEHLVNNDQEKAEELFHEYVVAKSREIYETLIESEVEDDEFEEADEKDEEDTVEEADEKEEEEVSEELSDDDFLEADDDDMMGGDETDKLAGELGEPMDDEEGEVELDSEGEEEIFQDLEAIIDELQSKFDELKGHEEDEGELDNEEEPEIGGEEMPFGDEEEVEDSFDAELATVREYVERINGGHGAEKKGAAESADNTQSIVDDMKNDMGGTTANILSDKTDEKGRTADKPKEEDMGNINKKGGTKSSSMMNKASGEAANSESGADNTDSLFRGKRS